MSVILNSRYANNSLFFFFRAEFECRYDDLNRWRRPTIRIRGVRAAGRPGGMRRRAGGRAAGRQSAAALRASRSRAAAGPGDMPARRGRDPRAATAASSPRPVDVCTPRSSPISHAITRLTSTGM